MQRLTRKQRAFVLAHAADPMGKQSDWARAAGYSDGKKGKGGACAVAATSLLRNPKIAAACFEVAQLSFRAKGPALAAAALLRIATSDGHKDQCRAAVAIADRVGLSPVQTIDVTHTHMDMTGNELIARIRELAHRNGLDAQKLLGANTEAIEAEYAVVSEDAQ
jgi:hypothetical protein